MEVFIITIYGIAVLIIAAIADEREIGSASALILCLVFTPIIGFFIVLGSDKKKARPLSRREGNKPNHRTANSEMTKKNNTIPLTQIKNRPTTPGRQSKNTLGVDLRKSIATSGGGLNMSDISRQDSDKIDSFPKMSAHRPNRGRRRLFRSSRIPTDYQNHFETGEEHIEASQELDYSDIDYGLNWDVYDDNRDMDQQDPEFWG